MKVKVSSLKNKVGESIVINMQKRIFISEDYNNKVVLLEGNLYSLNKGGFFLKAKINCYVNVNCARCMKSFDLPLNINIEEEFKETFSRKMFNENMENSYLENLFIDDVIDFEELVKQNIILSLPLAAVCQENCLGLCSKCGIDLNIKKCNCTVNEIDFRLAVLDKIKEKLNGKN